MTLKDTMMTISDLRHPIQQQSTEYHSPSLRRDDQTSLITKRHPLTPLSQHHEFSEKPNIENRKNRFFIENIL